MDVASPLLNCPASSILERVEEGALNPAWDIRGQGTRCAFVRIDVRALQGPVAAADFYNWLPLWDPKAERVAWMLMSSPPHVANLIKQGHLTTVGKPPTPKHSPRVSRESLLRFLQSRRIGGVGKASTGNSFKRAATGGPLSSPCRAAAAVFQPASGILQSGSQTLQTN